jgi:hypothetical protein
MASRAFCMGYILGVALEASREVVAQIIDDAHSLASWRYQDLGPANKRPPTGRASRREDTCRDVPAESQHRSLHVYRQANTILFEMMIDGGYGCLGAPCTKADA